MIAFLQYLPLLGLLVLANLAEENKIARQLTYLTLVLINLGFLGGGALLSLTYLLVNQPNLEAELSLAPYVSALPFDVGQVGMVLLGMAFLAFMFLLPAVRRALARWVPIDPRSPMDCTALALSVYYIGLTWIQIALLGGVSNLANVDLSLSVDVLLLNGLVLVLIALLGVGIGIRRKPAELPQRLGLGGIGRRHLLVAGGALVVFFALQVLVAALWSLLDPQGYEVISQAAEGLYISLDTPLRVLALALATGIGEEILFRGALQPRFGLGFTALVFALGHLQYGFTPALFQVFVVSLGLGWVRQEYNTTTCMIIHALYNMMDLVLISFLACV